MRNKNKIKGICINVHPLFFNNVLEKNRKSFEKKLNKSLTQTEVTGILANATFKLKPLKVNNKFAPKLRRRNFLL